MNLIFLIMNIIMMINDHWSSPISNDTHSVLMVMFLQLHFPPKHIASRRSQSWYLSNYALGQWQKRRLTRFPWLWDIKRKITSSFAQGLSILSISFGHCSLFTQLASVVPFFKHNKTLVQCPLTQSQDLSALHSFFSKKDTIIDGGVAPQCRTLEHRLS